MHSWDDGKKIVGSSRFVAQSTDDKFLQCGSVGGFAISGKSTGNFAVIMDLKRVLYDAHLLTTHTPSAKGPTLNCHSSVCFGRASFADSIENCTKHSQKAYLNYNLVTMTLILWVFAARLVGIIRDIILVVFNVVCTTLSEYCLAIFHHIVVLSYEFLCYRMSVHFMIFDYREDIIENKEGSNIFRATERTEYSYEELSLTSRTIRCTSLLKSSKTTYVTCNSSTCETLLKKDEDKSSNFVGNGNIPNFLKAERSRYCIYILRGNRRSSGLQRRRIRYREPSRICGKIKLLSEKKKRIRCLFKEKVLGSVPKSSVLYKFRRGVIREENVFLKYFLRTLVWKVKKKRYIKDNKRVKNVNCHKEFRNREHQRLHKKIKISNDIETNPGPVSNHDICNTIRGSFHQGNEHLFGLNAGKQCAANSLVAIVFNAVTNCFVQQWDSSKIDNILHVGNGLYSSIHSLIGKDFLLLSELPNVLCLSNGTYQLYYSMSMCGDINLPETRDCYFCLFEALSSLKTEYSACLLTIFCNTVAIFFSTTKVKLFDPHSRDVCGNICTEGSSVLLEFCGLEELICYLQRFYSSSTVVVPFDIVGVKVTRVMSDKRIVNPSIGEVQQNLAESSKVSMGGNGKLNGKESNRTRLDKIREQMRKRRKMETDEQKALTLKRMRERNHVKRQNERESEKNARVRNVREKKKERMKSETLEQRNCRLVTRNKQSKKKRMTETSKQRNTRLCSRNERDKERKKGERPKERKSRLCKRNEELKEKRKKESMEKRNLRLTKKRQQYSKKSSERMCDLISRFHQVIAEGPTYVCICCDQLWYKHGVKKATVALHLDNSATRRCIQILSISELDIQWICNTCLANLKQNKIPRCAIVNGMAFPFKPEHLDLRELEWRLVSPRLVFEKLHAAPNGKQMKISGNIVNVPANVVNTVTVLPRLSEQARTIKVQLKRKLKYKSYTLSQNIRPAKVFEAAKWLTENGSLFKQEKIVLNKDWISMKECCDNYSQEEVRNPMDVNFDAPSTSEGFSNNLESSCKDVSSVDYVYFCLECQHYVNTLFALNDHMVTIHKASCDSEDSSFSYRYNIISQRENEEDEHLYFCSLCNQCERQEKYIREHMSDVHDIPSEGFIREHYVSSLNDTVRVSIHRIVNPGSVLLVEVYKSGYMPRNRVNILVSVAVPGIVYQGISGNERLSCEKPFITNMSTISENESWEENNESEECAGVLDTMLISSDFVESDDHDELVFSFAPGEGSKPLSIFKDKYCEELAYPGIFCGERRAENSERDIPVYYSDICKSELRRRDRRASMCVENLFFKVKKLQMKILLGKCQVALRKHKTKGRKITAGDLKKDGAVEKLCHSDDGYRFLRALRGSPPYFEKAKKDLFAMIRQLGPATLFCSFSAAETKWNHLLRILGKLIDKKEYSDDELDNLTWEEKTRLIQSDPVTCARHFDYQFQQFFNKFLLSSLLPLGKIEDWFYRVEFQQRGSPHIHMLLWIEGAPRFGVQSDDEVVSFIDQIITCGMEANDPTLLELLVRQCHSHSQTCKKRNKMVCRFNFPQPPMRATSILYPLKDDVVSSEKSKHKAEFRKLHEKLNDMKNGEDIGFDDLLAKLGLSEERYILAIRSSLVGPTVFLKRNPNELRINNYNKPCLLAWRANMDIQYVLDVYACAMYIVSYISKAQRGMSELLRNACEEAKSGNSTVKQQVRDIGNKFLNAVEISAQEAVYLALQLPLRRSSREVVFIPSSPPDERIQLLKSIDQIKELEDDSEEIETGSLVKRYIERPHSLESVTLADWTAWYDCRQGNGQKFNRRSVKKGDTDGLLLETQDEDNFEDDIASHVTVSSELKGSTKILKKRSKCRVIRSVWFNKETDAEKHYRELLFLFTAWRDEERDIESFHPFDEKCRELSAEINVQLAQYCPYSSQIDEVMLDTRDNNDSEAWDILAPNTQHIEIGDSSSRSVMDSHNDQSESADQNYDLSDDLGIPSCLAVEHETTCNEMSDDKYRETVRSLNAEQLIFFYHILHHLRTSDVPFYCFLSGGGGVGKSHVTKALYQAAVKCLNRNAGDDFHQIKVLLIAPTGKAAFNIQGSTIHSAMTVPANRSLRSYQKLDSSRLNSIRNKLGSLKLIFIDEISMVGNSMFNLQLNKRLQEIKGVDDDFGGVSVIAVGDLFQLEPVFDGYVFEALKDSYCALATNLWRKHFTMYELCQIMRQRDSRLFAEILNRLREGKHTEEDIRTLKGRLISENDPNYPSHAPHLFYQNKKVERFNKKVYDASCEEKFLIKASDFVIGAESEQMEARLLSKIPNDPRKTMQLASELCIAINQRTEIAVNVRLDDGLTNGAGNVVKYVELCSPPDPEGVIWVKFDHDHVGQKTRNENAQLYLHNIDSSWTPIIPITAQFCVGRSTSSKIVRKQFPLRPSAAKTIHRAQGDTEREIVVDLETTRRVPHIHYVALSRVTTLEGLYITNLNEEKICVSSKVQEEMDRLRTSAYLKPCLQLINQLDDNFLKLFFLNTRSLHKHYLDVKRYVQLYSPHVAFFAETRLSIFDRNEEHEIEKYMLYRNDERGASPNSQRPFHGTAVYSCLQYVGGYPQCHNIFDVEITIAVMEILPSVLIAGIYRSPSVPLRQLYEALRYLHSNILCSKKYHVIFGDFNVNWVNKQHVSGLYNLMVSEFGYCQLVNDSTTCNGTLIDHIYTNIVESQKIVNVGVLETYFSDHKAVWIAIERDLQ